MQHVRAISPPETTDLACAALAEQPGVTNLVVIPGAARVPPGDVILCDVARESVNEVIALLRRLDLESAGSIAMEQVDLSLSRGAEAAERRAPGHQDDAVIWEQLNRHTADNAVLTWSFLAFLTLATQLVGIAVLLDSPILIVGAMVLGPEFGAVAAICYGLVTGRWGRVGRAVRTVVLGFALAISVTLGCALAARAIGWIDGGMLDLSPQTEFIVSPDKWSFIVALLAGVAGVLSITAAKSSALVGVVISVTTVPAAGTTAVGLALGRWPEVGGSFVQLGINLAGLVLAGTVTLLVQRTLTRTGSGTRGRRRAGRGGSGSTARTPALGPEPESPDRP